MPLILVVEQGEGVLERVLGALGPEGWRVVRAHGVTDAMGKVASEAPDLFLVSTAVERAQDILGPFARLRGGPGTLALIPEQPPEQLPEQAAGGDFGADGILREPFADDDLRDAVSRILRGADRRPSQPPGAEEPKLTSADIFGELVAEVEKEARDEASSRSRVKWGTPPQPAQTTSPGEATEPAERRRPARGVESDDEIERKLEQTLSGVLGPTRRPAASPPSPPARPASPPSPKAAGAAGEGRSEVDELISKTLSGLDLGAPARRKRPDGPAPAAPPGSPPPPTTPRQEPARPDAPFDLSDLEEMIRAHKAPPRRAAPVADLAPGADGAPPAEPPAEPEPPTAAAASEPVPEVTPEPVPEPGQEPVQAPPPVVPEPPPAPPKDSAPGVEFGQYRLLERIGVGGMAEVWKARMTGVEGFQKTVAIKKILPHLTDSPAFVDMFIDEAKLAAQLSHANIIHIYDLGKIGDDYYIAMEYVDGENLRDLLNVARERGMPLPIGLALYVAARLASALDHAHRKRDFEDRDLGLVHRDVSPQNVLIGYEGTIKLCDFGIVKAVSKSSHTQMGALKGKLQYMSPEQAWGKTVDGRSDIFAVGSLLFEMLTGRRLFAGDSEMEVLEAVRECRVQKPSEVRPEVSDEVDSVVLKALEAEPGERFQSAGELSKRLEELLAGLRPAPGQAELAAYVAELFDRAPADEPGREPRADLPLRESTGTAAPGKPVAASAAEAEAGTGAGSVASKDGSAVQAVEPVSEVEPEEGGRRGKGLLVAAIVVALLVGALLVWYVLRPKGEAEAPPVPEVPAQTSGRTGPPAAQEGAQAPAPDAAQGTSEESAQAREPAAAPRTAASASGPAPPSAGTQGGTAAGAEASQEGPNPEVAAAVDRALQERMARREKELRSQFEAQERRLKDQLDQIQKQKDGAGDGTTSPPPGASDKKAQAAPAHGSSAAAPKPGPGATEKALPPDASGGSGPATEAAGAASPPDQGSPAAATAEASPSGAPASGGETAAPPKPAPAADQAKSRPAPKPEPPPVPRKPSVQEGELVTDGPGVVRPQVVTLVKPEYPPIARRLRVEGEVVVSVLVGETGRVVDTRLDKRVRQDVGLNEAALEAARKARFRPATKNGVRVKMWTTISFPFKL